MIICFILYACFERSQLAQFYLIFSPFRLDTHRLPTWHDESTSIFRDTQQCVFQFFHSYHLRLFLSIYPTRLRRWRGRRCLGFCSTLDRWLGRRRRGDECPTSYPSIFPVAEIPSISKLISLVESMTLGLALRALTAEEDISSIRHRRPHRRVRSGGRGIMREARIEIGVF